jgi:PspA/IM30 family protein
MTMRQTTREALQRLIAVEHGLFEQMRQQEQLAARWQTRAELAARRGEDDLATEALARKAQHERRAHELRTQYLQHGDAVRKAKTRLVTQNPEVHIQAPAATLALRAAADVKLERLAHEDRLELDLQELKTKLAAS